MSEPREDLSAVAGLYPSETVCDAVTNLGSPMSLKPFTPHLSRLG